MRKIIPLIVLILLSAVFTKAQNFTQAEQKLALYSVEANKAAIGISADLISTSKVFYTYEDVATRIRYVSLQQTYKGIPVYNQILALSFRNDKLLSNFGIFDPSIEKSINVSSGIPSVTAESAVQSALSDRGFRASQMAIALNRKDQGRFVEFGNMGISRENITAQLSWVPNELTKTYNLAWQVYIIPKTTSDYWMVRVDAVNNSILGVDNYTDYDNWGTPNENPSINYPAFDYGKSIANNTNTATKNFFDFKKSEDPSLVTTASYRVIPLPAESPIHPGGAPALRTDPWLNAGVVANAVTLKWHTGAAAADYDYTRSNNVWAYEDRTAPANTGTIAKSASSTTAFPNLTFNFVPDFTLEPTVTSPPNQQFNITNLFYWNNIAHDVLYAYGFTEAGKNFQDDNLGRGGAGNDHVNAEAQDASGTNNANFSTPADGGSGRMQMYLWTAPTPDRDGDVDNGIILHELGHGVSNRSNPGGTGCLGNAEQAGEGWSDYIGLMLTQDWATSTVASGFNSPRGIGTYALNQPINGNGIRPQRYCTDFTVNNATYSTLPSQVIPHGVGWVFCSALWELTWELINDPSTTGIDANIYNFAGTGGNIVALRLVMEGLRTQQCQPGFISARNAIMRADTTLYGASHACAILRAFARRGMGLGAAEGSTSSISDQTVSFNGGGPSMTFTQNGAAGVPELQQIIYNHGVSAACSAVTNFTLRDTLPLNVTFVSAANGGTYAAGTRVVSWPVNVALNATQNYGLTVQINAGTYFPPVVLINEPVASTTISGFWTTASAPAGNPWIAHNVRSKSAPNSFFTSNLGSTSDQTIATTANFAIGASAPNLSFWHWYNSEPSWDGGVLEISLDGGTSWSDIGAANFTQNGYNGNLNASANPLGGRAAWNGNSSAFVETKVNMTPYANQATAKLRWRFGSDGSVAATGWNVDDITMQTIAVVNMRTSLFNAATVRVSFNDTVTVILAGAAVPPTVTINQAAAQPDPTSVSPINFTVVFDQVVTGFATGDVALTGTAGATTGTITGSGTTYNVAVSGMTVSGTVIATVPAGVAVNATNDPNVASTSTDNTVTFNFIPPPACVSTISYTGAPVAIPDATPAGVNIPITVSGLGTITDLNFRLNPGAGTCDATVGNTNASVDHTFNGDLIFTLTSPAATTITMINRRGGSGNNFCLVTLDDDGSFPATSTMSTAGAIAGNFAPENPLSAFDGQNPNGTWILNVSDNAGIDVGSVRGFSLIITSAAPTVNPRANDTLCAGATAGPYNFTSPLPGTTYTWTNNNTSIGLAANGTGNIPAFTATNATLANITATITVTPSNGGCTGPTNSFSITVYPTGNVNAVPNQVVCKGQPTAPVNFTGTVPNTVFNWTNNNTSIGLAATGNGNIASFIAQNPSGVAQVATITVTPVYSPGGPGTPVVTNFNFTGAVQTWVVPAGVTSVTVKTWGAQGNSNALSVVGGLGGYAEGTLAVTPGQTLFINTGGGASTTINGGFNGGGAAGVNSGCATAQGGGGGGASDIRVSANTLAARAIVAGGGGGAGGNRVASCGRGTGGGGGGGYFGGGGGAGWPGVPPGGPVPTGGTQAAGGAGGVTTFSPGPTNGFPGASGIGGAGGTEIGSGQGGSATAESGGVGGGLTGASGNYNPTNNWCGQSGAGGSSFIGGVTSGITTPGIRSGNGQVQITYAPLTGLTCAGTQRTFTITVNPNQDLIIVADPGTTLCEGDPTLLTVYNAGSATGPGNLYVQTATQVNGTPSQVFEPVNAAFNSQTADDFTIPNATNWSITNITANGIGTGSPTSVNVFFYANSGSNLPGAAVASYTNLTSFVRTGGNYNVTLPAALNLGSGTYWVSVQVNMSFAAGGQWFWGNFGGANIGSEYAFQNPGGGFATPCTNWGYAGTGCNVGGGAANRNSIFSVIGSSVTVGTIATGTFLWSPAAGLSSTTSNPVAASPANTTTYTVTRTTGAGCVASAQITITVNKRPTVTIQPVSGVNCSGTTATFTVAGTGTGLTYQWQVSTAGCAGPWVNVPTVAPYFGGTTPTLTIAPTSVIMNGYAYRAVLSGTCPAINNANISSCVTLTVNPLPNISVTPPVSCGGVPGISGTLLTVTSGSAPVPGNVSVNSGVISVTVPDGTNQPALSNLTVAGVPANATISEIKVNINMNHTWVGDMDINLRAPNNAILNLVGSLNGGTGGNATANFTNTTFSSIGATPISGAPAPRTGTFAAEARAGFGPIGYIQTVNTWPGLVPTATPLLANGIWTLAMGDDAGGDVGILTNWSISIDYTTTGTGTPPTLSYVWSPLTGLYNDPLSTIPYTGTNTATVYAAPSVQTTYTVTATNVGTGCTNTATALVNYTPPAPTVTPNPVTMCLGDPAVLLRSSSSTAFSATFNSGALSLAIPDGPATWPQTLFPGVSTPNLAIAGIPANATITGMSVRLNLPHTYIADMVIVLKAPNGGVLNIDANINRTGGPGANFINTIISSTSATALSAGAPPYTGTFRPDAVGATYIVNGPGGGNTFPGGPTSPAGYIPTVSSFSGLYSVPNGNWTLGMYDWGAGDLGTLTNWEIKIDYVIGVPASPAVWTPITGLFSNAAATIPYVAGTPVDSVWTRPSATTTYQVTVQNIISSASTIATPMAGGNGNNLVAFNVRNNNLIPVTFSSIASNTFGSGAVVSRVFFKPSPIAGAPGPISVANGWTQFGTANNNVTAGTLNQLMSGLTLQIPAGATYGIALDMTGATFPAYTNGGAIVTYSNGGCDLITGGNVGWGGPAAPGTPGNNPRNFNGSVVLLGSGAGTCTSPPRLVTVTVNQPTTVATQPVAQTVCTDKIATFTVTAGGTGPFSYRWQVSTNGNNPPWTFVNNGGVYSGATTATLTITAPPLSMNGYFYRAVINGAAPCAADTSFGVRLTVNPLPTIVISNSPTIRSLLPGLTTTLSAVVTPNAAVLYSWLRNGVEVATTPTYLVNIDRLGTYQLRVTDINGCTNLSNTITIKDSISGKCFIYPNPTSGQFEVRYYSSFNDIAPRALTIFDAKGDRVFTKLYTIGRAYERMPVDMRAYGKGLYWVEISDVNGNRLTMCRVVIQ